MNRRGRRSVPHPVQKKYFGIAIQAKGLPEAKRKIDKLAYTFIDMSLCAAIERRCKHGRNDLESLLTPNDFENLLH